MGNCAFNLLTKDDCRAALADEVIPRRPKMAGIGAPSVGPRCAEGLAGATTCPNRSVIGPASESEGVAPAADPGKEVALGETSQVAGVKGLDVTLVYLSIGNQAVFDQLAQPRGGERIMLVVVGAHATLRSCRCRTRLRLNSRSILDATASCTFFRYAQTIQVVARPDSRAGRWHWVQVTAAPPQW